MTKIVTHIYWLSGSVRLPEPTGVWLQQEDGGWYEEHTPGQILDDAGRVVSETPYKPCCVTYGFDVPGMILASGGRVVARREVG